MSVNLYRLFSVQSFNRVKVAIYICEGNYPDGEILTYDINIAEGNRTRKEVLKYKNYMYGSDGLNPESSRINRDRLLHYTHLLRYSKRVRDKNGDVDKAIFVNSNYPRDWVGERTLYENKVFDIIKADTPSYSGCEAIGTIKI